MTTRLDRLFLLLDTGSTPLIRKSAADQLGTVQKLHPHELNNLLGKVQIYLRSSSWDTRVAAGQAVGAVCRNVPQWRPDGVEDEKDVGSSPSSSGLLTFDQFDLSKVMRQGASLLGSEGAEYETPPPVEKECDPRQRLVRQREQLNQRLGLNIGGATSGLSLADLVEDEDLEMKVEDVEVKPNVLALVEQQQNQEEGEMSARERNRAKRKAKLLSRKISVEPKNGDMDESLEPPCKRQRSAVSGLEDRQAVAENAPDSTLDMDEMEDWPFQTFCALLTQDLFHCNWEIRHGAATGLRDVIKHHGNGAGRSSNSLKSQMELVNDAWLSDLALRLMCVMALDRFGDFVSDEVVAPVRETCAQALGSVAHCMRPDAVQHVLSVLLSLFSQPSWEVRHGGLLGIKYLLAVRKDLTATLLPAVLPSIFQVLRDHDDDVRAVAAASLVSVVDDLRTNLPLQVPSIVTSLWDTLLDLDDLTASTNSVMALLAALLKTNSTDEKSDTKLNILSLSVLVPRLWPFFRHTITSVRRSALETLQSVLQANSAETTACWLGPILHDTLRHVFQRALLETDLKVQRILERVWRCLVDVSPVEYLMSAPWYSLWLCLLMQPSNVPYDRNLLVEAQHRTKEQVEQKIGRKETALKETVMKETVEFIGGQDVHDRELVATQARVTGARLLAYVCQKASQPFNQSQCSMNPTTGAMTSSSESNDDVASKTPSDDVETETPPSDDVDTPSNDVKTETPPSDDVKTETLPSDDVIATQTPSKSDDATTSSSADNVIKNEAKIKTEAAEIKKESETESTPAQPVETFGQVFCGLLLFHLKSNSAMQRIVCNSVIREWALLDEAPVDEAIKDRLLQMLTEPALYDEVAVLFTRMQTECKDFIACLNQRGANVGEVFQHGPLLTVDQALSLLTTVYDQVIVHVKQRFHAYFKERQSQVSATVHQMAREQRVLTLRVSASLSGALVVLKCLPAKMNPIIRPLMDTIKTEEDPLLQSLAAENLARVLSVCIGREPCPNPKVVKNLCSFLCREPLLEDVAGSSEPITWSESSLQSGVISLHVLKHLGERKRPGKKSVVHDVPADVVDDADSPLRRMTQHHGAMAALCKLTRYFSNGLETKLPSLWSAMFEPLSLDFKLPQSVAKETVALTTVAKDAETVREEDGESVQSRDRLTPAESGDEGDDVTITWSAEELEAAETLCQCLQILSICGPEFDTSIRSKMTDVLSPLSKCLRHQHALVRHRAAKCLSVLVHVLTSSAIHYIIQNVVPMLGESDDVTARSGSVEAVHYLMTSHGTDLVPYLSLLVSPLLGRMSDQYEPVRQMAAQSFATLVQLLPLEPGSTCPADLPDDIREQRERDRQFVDQLLHPQAIKPYTIPVNIDATLRAYQQEGVSWLNFLNVYNLHGILCDDMGLGKSIQSICILAGDLHQRRAQYKSSKRADSRPLPSLIICPSTLINHWIFEIEKFVSKKILKPAAYSGLPPERKKLQSRLDKYDVVVASYEIVRNDIDFFGSIHWNYCILDEGHIIKNTKAKVTKAIKRLEANHRLILSGTPIQNNVLELWSLFDFLMPGFLGTERQFIARFARPIQQSRDAKSTSKEQESGALAMERLHRQVLPFILRRLKEDVLQDLPPKIIQDYQCELSKLQVDLYEYFTQSQQLDVEGEVNIKKNAHVFQAIQYLRKVCVHPALVLTPQHPQYARLSQKLAAEKSSLDDITHSCKLLALRQLLLDCGIGAPSDGCGENEPVVNQHRVLLFCQLKAMLDIIEKHLFKAHMKQVTYLRLDGSVPADSRMKVVNRFNNDPSIDVLLLTTHVGGLGLNLTGADTVIFVEHDWNPMRDLQAMDRAHRIGQKKVVNVYRLISRGTLEEKIMGLQKFKMSVANTVVSQDNSSMEAMATGDVLDLFSLDDKKAKPRKVEGGKLALKTVLDGLDELWGEGEYAEEYHLDGFVASLPKS